MTLSPKIIAACEAFPHWLSDNDQVMLVNADCLAVLPLLPAGCVDAVVTRPPYGIDYQPVRSQRSAASGYRKPLAKVKGDEKPFDPRPLLSIASQCVLWGANNFAHLLPPSNGWLAWDKRDGGSIFRGFAASDFELAWCNCQGKTSVISHKWCGHLRESERDLYLHPTQKPTAVMAWCLSFVKGQAILDPFMGSGTTGVACIQTGRAFVGIEIEPKYFEIAKARCAAACKQTLPLRKGEFPLLENA